MADLPTLAQYEKATPYVKGFLSYTFSQWPGSTIPEKNPFDRGTVEASQFADGVHAATIAAQDSEE